MREIKFRGKTFGYTKNKWVYGSLLIGNQHSTKACNICPDGADGFYYTVWPESVGQYIGLKDKNGKDMYKGDIIKHNGKGHIAELAKNSLSEIIWHELGWYYMWYQIEHYNEIEDKTEQAKWQLTKIYSNDSNTEIIGNIYDNPELIEK